MDPNPTVMADTAIVRKPNLCRIKITTTSLTVEMEIRIAAKRTQICRMRQAEMDPITPGTDLIRRTGMDR